MHEPTLQDYIEMRDDLNFTDDDCEVMDAAVTLAEEFAKALAALMKYSHANIASFLGPERDAAALLDRHLPNWRDHE